MNVVIVDDDPLARAALRHLLREERDFRVVGEAADGATALALLKEETPSLLFLDVELPDMPGIDVLAQLPAGRRPPVIFTTAHPQFAVDAFEFRALDYLLKPFRDDRFHEALERARRALQQPAIDRLAGQVNHLLRHWPAKAPTAGTLEPQFMAKSGNDLHVFKLEQIKWVEAQGDYLKLHGTIRSTLVRETMKHFLARAPAGIFLRVHKSAIVNLRHVRRLTPLRSGDYQVELLDGSSVRASRNYFAQLKRALAP